MHEGAVRKVFIVISPAHAYLADLMAKAFEGLADVEVIVERRRGERRTRQQPVAVEERRAERRRAGEEIGEIVITGVRAAPRLPRP